MREIITLDLKRELTNRQISGLWSEFTTQYQRYPDQPAYQLYAEGCCNRVLEILVEVNKPEGKATMRLANLL